MTQTSEEAGDEAIGPGRLFIAFSSLSLSGFGGVLPFAYRALVEKRRWLEAREFASLLAIAQVMPGPTICNLSVMIGQRHAGFAGASAALAGMVLGPSCIVIALGIGWQHYGELHAIKHALGGMSAVAIGLILATAVKMGINLFRAEPAVIDARPVPGAGASGSAGSVDGSATPSSTVPTAPSTVAALPNEPPELVRYWNRQRFAQVALCALGFAGVGLLRWPLAAVVAGLAPIAVASSWLFES